MPAKVPTRGRFRVTGGGGGGGDLLADGTIPLTANWDVGAFDITADSFISNASATPSMDFDDSGDAGSNPDGSIVVNCSYDQRLRYVVFPLIAVPIVKLKLSGSTRKPAGTPAYISKIQTLYIAEQATSGANVDGYGANLGGSRHAEYSMVHGRRRGSVSAWGRWRRIRRPTGRRNRPTYRRLGRWGI